MMLRTCWYLGMLLMLWGSTGFAQNHVEQLIVKYRPELQAKMTGSALQARLVNNVANSTGLQVSYKRPMSEVIGAHVLKLPYVMSFTDAQLYAKAVMDQHPEMLYVEPDSKRYPRAKTPDDPEFAKQWYLQAPEHYAGAANLVNAWSLTQGSSDIVVGILDSGILEHADLVPNLVSGKASRAGFDMISDAETANDNDGRDANPVDTGAAVGSSTTSAWHGTHIAGIVAAKGDNNLAVAGTAWATRLLSVRILSDQGGSMSDEVDGMLWAAGEPVPGLPVNPNPAHIVNLSIGTDSFEECSRTEQAAVDTLKKLGLAVVVAAGNENRNVEGSSPANCKGVIAVTGLTKDGARAPFANYGTANTIAAPAVDIVSTYNTGAYAPEQDSVHAESGTSQAAPQVAGILALMLASNDKLRDGSVVAKDKLVDFLKERLQKTARPFPSSISGSSDAKGCNPNQETACICTTETCGAGIVDAYRAVKSVGAAPKAVAGKDQSVALGASVSLDAGGSSDDTELGSQIVQYAWTQLAGDSVALSSPNQAKVSFTAPAKAQDLRFKLIVTDDTGLSAEDEILIKVQSIDDESSNSKVGGSTDVCLLCLLVMGLVARYFFFWLYPPLP
ncbi:MAG: hypothetical protein CR991_03575 [Proteobacteria bacterium]|nr:MAG: hypothetical protein CR991_03575 [Pseudomonadota bacterium]